MRVILKGKVVQKLRLKLSTSFLDSINAPSAFEHLVHEIQQKFHDVKKKINPEDLPISVWNMPSDRVEGYMLSLHQNNQQFNSFWIARSLLRYTCCNYL